MLVSHEHKLVIFTSERTASQCIHSSTGHLFEISIDGTKHRHLTALDYDKIIVPFVGNDYYKIAVVRDPIQRIISFYNKIKVRNFKLISIDDWWIISKKNNTKFISQYKQLLVNNQVYLDRLFDFNQIDLLRIYLEQVFGKTIKFKKVNQVIMNTTPLPKTIADMQSYLKDDIIFYKSIVDAGGELIINPYHPTP
jgi:hypothetical protein